MINLDILKRISSISKNDSYMIVTLLRPYNTYWYIAFENVYQILAIYLELYQDATKKWTQYWYVKVQGIHVDLFSSLSG